jgi:hypothetical protein
MWVCVVLVCLYEQPSEAQAIFIDLGVAKYVAMVPQELGTAVAAAASNATVSEGSTIAVQSCFIGVPSFYLATNGSIDSRNVLVASGAVPVATSIQEATAVLNTFQKAGWHFDREWLDSAGIPTNATAIMLDRVERILGRK